MLSGKVVVGKGRRGKEGRKGSGDFIVVRLWY